VTFELNGIRIWVAPISVRKSWAMIETPPGGAPFSFHDWFDMVQAVCQCEILKYGNGIADRVTWDKWTDLSRRFVLNCFEYGIDYESLRRTYRLPR
jgi:hypothetical protein